MARGLSLLLLVVLASVVPGAGTAVAHEEKRVGPLALEAGWLQEPAYAGLPNAVEVTLNRGNAPVAKASLTVEVAFGEPGAADRTGPLPLDPVPDEPGEYRAFVIPTRPGTYSFVVTGRAEGKKIDEAFTSGPQTFDDVVPASTRSSPRPIRPRPSWRSGWSGSTRASPRCDRT